VTANHSTVGRCRLEAGAHGFFTAGAERLQTGSRWRDCRCWIPDQADAAVRVGGPDAQSVTARAWLREGQGGFSDALVDDEILEGLVTGQLDVVDLTGRPAQARRKRLL
jgi:hypothetical protein